ncbi:MAG: acetaldehyde dehydrogenase (acetylating) [Veillonellales bacterium]
MNKVRVAIMGSGNIGTDLMYKLKRSKVLEPKIMIGIDPNSTGLQRAKNEGLLVSHKSIEAVREYADLFDIIFDSTSAGAHIANAPVYRELGKIAIDLTPAAVGPFVIPSVNIKGALKVDNVNMVTCGGQATVPITYAISQVVPVSYAEIVATISSKSAGPGTRANIDEFTETTGKAQVVVAGAKKGKAIIVLNPAEPPINMRDTVRCLMDQEGPEVEKAVAESIDKIVKQVQRYVPGYRLKHEPQFDGNRVTVFIEVEGLGDFLPKYSGNLDIMNCAAVCVAEAMAAERFGAK